MVEQVYRRLRFGNTREMCYLENLGVDREIILNWILKKQNERARIRAIGIRTGKSGCH
jgi:hypothetical protein